MKSNILRSAIVSLKISLTVSVAFTAGLVAVAHASPSKKAAADADIKLPDPQSVAFDQTTTTNRLKAFTDKRKPAKESESFGESNLSEGFKKFRDRFLAAKNASDVEKLLIEADKNYDSYDIDLKYFVAQAELARPFRSIVYRTRPLFEQHKYRTIQSLSVASIRGVAEDLRIFTPTPQWEAMFEYFTAPFPAADAAANAADEVANNTQFKTVHDVQLHLMKSAPEFIKAIKRITDIYTARPKNHPIVWDNKLFFGTGSFPDDLDRYRTFGDAEITATLATLHSFMHNAYVFAAYNQEDSMDVSHALGKLVGMDGFELWGDVGPTSEQKTKAINKFPHYLTLTDDRGVTGVQMMANALAHLKSAVYYSEASWNFLANSDDAASRFAVMNPMSYKADRRVIDLRLKTMKDMVAGPTTVRSVVTGETANVNVPAFYTSPPSDLKVFLPTAFDNSGKEKKVDLGGGKQVSYRNYFNGRAVGWNTPAWSKYSTSIARSDDPAKVIRVLNQSFGGDAIAPIAYLFAR